MVGDKLLINGVEYEVVWSGGEGLVPDRETKSLDFWIPPKRLYNKKSEYWLKSRKPINPIEDGEEIKDGKG